MGQLYDPKNIIFREGTTRKDYEENFHRLHMLYEAKKELTRIDRELGSQWSLIPVVEDAKRDYEKACKALFGRAKREAAAKAALDEAQRNLDAYYAKKKDLAEKIRDCETGIRILEEKMGLKKLGPGWAKRYYRCFAEMRANTMEEAIAICTEEARAEYKPEWIKKQEAHEAFVKKRMQEVILLQTASDREIALHKASVEAEEARIKAETAAAKAHNAAVINDYLWHAMAGDISDMESYALMKVGELEI